MSQRLHYDRFEVMGLRADEQNTNDPGRDQPSLMWFYTELYKLFNADLCSVSGWPSAVLCQTECRG